MSRSILSLIFLILISLFSYSQNSDADSSLILNREIEKNDSIMRFDVDSITQLNLNDSVQLDIKKDTLTINDTLIIKDSVNLYQQILNELQDSLIFENADTLHYVAFNLDKLLQQDSQMLSDTTKQAIHKLIDYTTNQQIDTVINFLKARLKSIKLKEYTDSSQQIIADSIYNSVEYLINSIPEDSIKFSFTNIMEDSILFRSTENDIDSVRLNLYDNRGEYAVLWIKKSDKNVFEIYLEDGIYIEKAKQKNLIDQYVDADFSIPKLRKVKKNEKIIPIWNFEGLADIKFNQGYVSESWAEGGESSISTLSILQYSADYSYGKINNFDTDFEYRLGYIKAGDNDLQKNDDKLEINLKYGKLAFKNWYYSSLLNFKTQLLKGYDYSNDTTIEISAFLSPAYLVFSLGLDYKPSNKLTILISPLTSKFTIVADTVNYDQTRFGVGKDELIRKEIGAYIKAISKIKFRDNIILENKVNFFTNYTHNPQNIDVDWELNLGIKLTDYIKMSINAHYIYDDDVEVPIVENGTQVGTTKKGQFKELFGIGFSYSF